jgi:hypothetical protein
MELDGVERLGPGVLQGVMEFEVVGVRFDRDPDGDSLRIGPHVAPGVAVAPPGSVAIAERGGEFDLEQTQVRRAHHDPFASAEVEEIVRAKG